jgi:formate dehydrogenase maturation protein FdhE
MDADKHGFSKNNSGFANYLGRFIFVAMSSVQEIEAVIPKLSRAEVEEVRAWIDDFLEDQLELTDDVKTKLDQSRREIAAGDYTTRQPK